MLAEQHIECGPNQRQQRGGIDVRTRDRQPHWVLEPSHRLDVDQECRHDRVGDSRHRRTQHPHELEQDLLTEDRLHRTQPRGEEDERLREHGLLRIRIGEPRRAHQPPYSLLTQP